MICQAPALAEGRFDVIVQMAAVNSSLALNLARDFHLGERRGTLAPASGSTD